MDETTQKIDALREQIAATERLLKDLKVQLSHLEAAPESHTKVDSQNPILNNLTIQDDSHYASRWPLSPEEYKRYGRQMIVPNIGIQGQLRLKSSKFLLVGAGGLGCPAAAYLAGAGVGTLGMVDGDVVEISNLHRQILHSTDRVGMKKVDSAITYLKALNPNVTYIPHTTHLTPTNAESIVQNYDLVLDCTDNPTSRYLISDICVLLHKPLISASALRTDGQLIVLNSPPSSAGSASGGPCYRCIFPKPPPADSVVTCGDGGILGPVVGVMGVLQAVEALKLITQGKLSVPVEVQGEEKKSEQATMLLFSATGNPPFRSLKMRPRRAGCFACSKESGVSLESLRGGSMDYVLFCGVTSPVTLLGEKERVDAGVYAERRTKGEKHLLVDVRDKVQFDICSLEGSVNMPFSSFPRSKDGEEEERPEWLPNDLPSDAPIYVVCRLGNDSQVITKRLLDAGLGKGGRYIGDIKGGLRSWKADVDNNWPDY